MGDFQRNLVIGDPNVFEIHKDLEFADNKKVAIYLTNGNQLVYDNILEFNVSRYHLSLVLRLDNNKCKGICIPKTSIAYAQRFLPLLNKFVQIKLNIKKPKRKKYKLVGDNDVTTA